MGGLSEKDRAPSLEDSSADDERPGHVVDNRGRSVWQWANVSSNSTSVLLKRLEHPDLALEDPDLAKERVDRTAGRPGSSLIDRDEQEAVVSQLARGRERDVVRAPLIDEAVDDRQQLRLLDLAQRPRG
mgnify:CR=1 FL=1